MELEVQFVNVDDDENIEKRTRENSILSCELFYKILDDLARDHLPNFGELCLTKEDFKSSIFK